jgi:hypothetical protein
MKRSSLLAAVIVLMLGLSSKPVDAAPILGSFSITGNFLAVDATGALAPLQSATALDFIDLLGSTPTPGTAGEFLVNSANGNFASLVGQIGTVSDFSFAGAGSAAFPKTPLLAFQSVGGLTFDLMSVAIVRQTSAVLNLTGAGVFNMDGFEATAGTFKFSGNEADQTFSFSASEKATGIAVPEPTSVLLFGLGAFGFVVRGRRHGLAVVPSRRG